MDVSLGINKSDERKINKKIEWVLKSVDCVLKYDTSVTDPTVTISKEIIDREDLKDINYMYIPKFGRYYFITDMVHVMGHVMDISGHTDVLSTVKSKLTNKQAYIVRNEYDNNPYYQDSQLPIRSDKQYIKLNVGTVGNASHIYITVNNGKKIGEAE